MHRGSGMPGRAEIRCHLYFEIRTDKYRLKILLYMMQFPTHGNGSWIMLKEKSGSPLEE